MSRANKVNRDRYTQAGRLTPDDLARERRKQQDAGLGTAKREKPTPPWMRSGAPAQATSIANDEGTSAPAENQPELEPEQQPVSTDAPTAPPRASKGQTARRRAPVKAAKKRPTRKTKRGSPSQTSMRDRAPKSATPRAGRKTSGPTRSPSRGSRTIKEKRPARRASKRR